MNRHHLRLLTRKWARTLHIYISMLGLILIVFFAATGLFLNHPDTFGLGRTTTRRQQGTMPAKLLETPPDRDGIERELRTGFGATGQITSFEDERTELRVTLKGPGRSVEAVIQRKDGRCEVITETRGALGRMAELHRGTESGPAWRLVIDATAILTFVVAGSGIVLWLIVPKWRRWGVAALVVCVAVCGFVYWVLVP